MSDSIRVFVVDDSKLIREILCEQLAAADGIEVIGTAADGREALAAIPTSGADVVTLDVEMPKLDGLATLAELLKRNPLPVIMVSTLTQRAAATTLEALDHGAMDYVGKPTGLSEASRVFGVDLVRKIRAVAGANVKRVMEIRAEQKARRTERRREARQQKSAGGNTAGAASATPAADASEFVGSCIALGISTGGPPALNRLFESLGPPTPPIVVVQHMPEQFTPAFAKRLDGISLLDVKHAASGDLLQTNCVYIAPGGHHLRIQKSGTHAKLVVCDGPPVRGHKPSVDVMMQSAAEAFGSRCLGVIMTGMGRDGSDGCAAIRSAGGYVLGQDQDSSDVYGMNKIAMVEGNVDRQFALDQAAAVIRTLVKQRLTATAHAAT